MDQIERGTFSKAEVAGTLGISLPTVERLIRKGKLKAIRVSPRRVVISNAELQRFLGATDRVAPYSKLPAGNSDSNLPRWEYLQLCLHLPHGSDKAAEHIEDSEDVNLIRNIIYPANNMGGWYED